MKRPPKRRLVPIEAPWLEEPGVVRVLEPSDPHDRAPPDHPYRHRLGQPFILDQPDTRTLYFTLDAVQSSMRLDAPHALTAPYKHKMMAFLLFNPDPRHIVMLGLGGGSLGKFCYRHLPAARLTVVEINADIIALRKEFLVPEDDSRFRVVHADGAHYVRTVSEPVDVMLVDAFDSVGIAPSFASAAFYRNAAERLGPQGLFVMNLSGDRRRYGATFAGARAAFGDRLLLVPVEGRNNLVLFGFKTGDPKTHLEGIEERAEYLAERLDLEFPRLLSRLREGHTLRTKVIDR
jgi:spermidine synthase